MPGVGGDELCGHMATNDGATSGRIRFYQARVRPQVARPAAFSPASMLQSQHYVAAVGVRPSVFPFLEGVGSDRAGRVRRINLCPQLSESVFQTESQSGHKDRKFALLILRVLRVDFLSIGRLELGCKLQCPHYSRSIIIPSERHFRSYSRKVSTTKDAGTI